jgi:hypothetical protein
MDFDPRAIRLLSDQTAGFAQPQEQLQFIPRYTDRNVAKARKKSTF